MLNKMTALWPLFRCSWQLWGKNLGYLASAQSDLLKQRMQMHALLVAGRTQHNQPVSINAGAIRDIWNQGVWKHIFNSVNKKAQLLNKTA